MVWIYVVKVYLLVDPNVKMTLHVAENELHMRLEYSFIYNIDK